MRFFALFLALFALRAASDKPLSSEYRERREELRKKLNDGVIVLFGRTEQEQGELRNGFLQDPDFYYLTGWLEPGAALLLAPDKTEMLLLPRRVPEREKWTGRKTSPDDPDVRKLTGFERVAPAETLESELRGLLDRYARIYTVTGTEKAKAVQSMAPLREVANASVAIAALRMVKSAAELALIQRAIDVTVDAHRAAWKRAAPGLFEYQVAATMTGIYFEAGCERGAYAPIIGSGPNSAILHYSRNSRRMDRGELLLMDVGAECGGYAADITRTIPVGGKFSPRQREIYDIVLGAQKAAIAAIKPGMSLGKTGPDSLYRIAYDYIDSHGKDLHGATLGKYFTHGLGHQVGLEVHDATDPGLRLAEGMVITIEPGVYIPEESLGVRIEDMLLVTKNGSKLLSAALPREPDQIEKLLAR